MLVLAVLLVVALPLVGFVSLLLRKELDPHVENYRLHFVVFGIAGGVAFTLGYTAGEAANRRGDARVLLLSLAFMATGRLPRPSRPRDPGHSLPEGTRGVSRRDPG
jgi:hypothetical protein